MEDRYEAPEQIQKYNHTAVYCGLGRKGALGSNSKSPAWLTWTDDGTIRIFRDNGSLDLILETTVSEIMKAEFTINIISLWTKSRRYTLNMRSPEIDAAFKTKWGLPVYMLPEKGFAYGAAQVAKDTASLEMLLKANPNVHFQKTEPMRAVVIGVALGTGLIFVGVVILAIIATTAQ